MPRALTDSEKHFLLSLKPEEITIPLITKYFGYRLIDRKTFKYEGPKIPQNSTFSLKAGEYINKDAVQKTNAGILLFNKLIIDGKISHIVPNGYYNEVLTSKKVNALFDMMATAVTEGKLDIKSLVKTLKAIEFYGLKTVSIFSPSFTEKILKPDPNIMAQKDCLLKEMGDAKDLKTMVDIEDKLVSDAKKANKDDAGMTLYDSGSRGSFDNDYKNISVMIGPTFNPQTGEYELMTSNYMDGLKKEDIPKAGNSVVSASYPKAVGTAVGGYLTKQFYSVYQSIVLDEPETNCGSKGYITITLTKENVNSYMYQNIIENDKLITLTPENQDQYIGKTIKLRSPMYCLSDKICSACAGRRFYIMGLRNVGLTTGRVSNTLMSKQMKKFHVTKVKLNDVDPNKILI